MNNSTTRLSFNRKIYTCLPGETVLDALLRQGTEIPNRCRRQICLSCLMCSLNGLPPTASQASLNETLKIRNYFLACACKPEKDMEISLPQKAITMEVPATIVAMHKLTPALLSIRLQYEEAMLEFKGGQSVILLNNDKLGILCPIVSSSNASFTDQIEIHLNLDSKEYFSGWVSSNARAGTKMYLYGPIGQMIYHSTHLNQAILLVAKDYGLSPLLGIVQDIFNREHAGIIYLFHEVQDKAHLYLADELNEIGLYYPNFHYIPCIQHTLTDELSKGLASQCIKQTIASLIGWQVYISGPKNFVNFIQKQAYLAGAKINDIFVEINE